MHPMNVVESALEQVLAFNGLKRKLTREEDLRARKVVGQFRFLSFASVLLVLTLVASAFLADRRRDLDPYVLVTRFSALLIPACVVYLTARTMRAYRERPYAILEIDERTIRFSLSISSISLPWRKVHSVRRNQRHIEVRAQGDRLMLIPTSLFKNLKEADRFVEAANGYQSVLMKHGPDPWGPAQKQEGVTIRANRGPGCRTPPAERTTRGSEPAAGWSCRPGPRS